jgi:dihydroorotase/N-acyl-D-amino-acid deacylase
MDIEDGFQSDTFNCRNPAMSQSTTTILTGGAIVDGTGAPQISGDVVIQRDRIVSVDRTQRASTYQKNGDLSVIDCTGCVIAPGFIDAHSHSDLQVLENRTEKLLQGVTTEDSWRWNSASDYLASASDCKVATIASLVGHGSLRINVAGNTSRALTARELDTMAGLLDDALQEGAAGFSSGLMYAPGSGASPQELMALCRVVARRGGVYATHMRSYSDKLVEAVEEQISIAESSGCRLQISHLQAAGPDNWNLQKPALALIEEASKRGVDVAFDAYPWLAGCTVLTQVLPQTALDGGISQLLTRLADPAQRAAIRPGIKAEARWNKVVITSAAKDEAWLVGRSIQEISDERGSQPEDVVMDILLDQEGNVNIVEHAQSIENLRSLMTHPLSIVITDGVYTAGRSHPRLYGTFPKLLGKMVRERGWLTLEEAIHKVTGKPASVFHLRDRGNLAPGNIADLTIFDPKTIRTDATYEKPDVAPTGLKAVLRNGRVVVDSGKVV